VMALQLSNLQILLNSMMNLDFMYNINSDFLQQGRLYEALLLLSDNNSNAKLILNDYQNEKRLLELSVITQQEWEKYCQNLENRILFLENEISKNVMLMDSAQKPEKEKKSIKVFISYNVLDSVYVAKIVDYFKGTDIDYFIDSEAMMPGENIKQRVEKEIKKCDYFLIVLSQNSLASNWVLLESFFAYMKKRVDRGKLLPVIIDDYLFNDTFVTGIVVDKQRQVDEIDLKIEELKKISAGFTHLMDKRNMLTDFKNKFDVLIKDYRDSSVTNIGPEEFGKGMDKLVSSMKKTNS
jgi:TIR domain